MKYFTFVFIKLIPSISGFLGSKLPKPPAIATTEVNQSSLIRGNNKVPSSCFSIVSAHRQILAQIALFVPSLPTKSPAKTSGNPGIS
jgi:hypothetical protein